MVISVGRPLENPSNPSSHPLQCRLARSYLRYGIYHAVGLIPCAALSQNTLPQLHPNDAKDEEHKETEQEDIPEHGQRVEE